MGGKKFRFKKPQLKTWYFLVALIPMLFINATFLRFDHLKMVELRDAVLAADAAEDDEKIASSLEELKNFTFQNIVVNVVDDNGSQRIIFGTGPFYLEHQYRRAAEKALAEAEASLTTDDNPNGNIYAAASEVCKARAIQNGWSWSNPNYINCMTSEIEKYPAAANIVDQISAAIPSTELYRKNYASPIWAPSWSGFFILITVVIFIIIIVRFLIWLVLRLSLIFL